MNADRVNALRIAVETLSGEGGGYTEDQKRDARIILWNMYIEERGDSVSKPVTDTPEPHEHKPVTVTHEGTIKISGSSGVTTLNTEKKED